jgi:hypothetical protein
MRRSGPGSHESGWAGWSSWPPSTYGQAWLVAVGIAVLVPGLVFLVFVAEGIWPGWLYYWLELGAGVPLSSGLGLSCIVYRRRRQAERAMACVIGDGQV